MKENQDFECHQGVTRVVTVNTDDSAGDPKTLDSAEWYAFKNQGDRIEEAVLSKTGSDITLINIDGTDDGVRFTMQPKDSARLEGNYYHETWGEDATGNRDLVAIGKMIVLASGGKG